MIHWNPNYAKEAIRREKLINAFYDVPNPREEFKKQYKDDPVAFIQDWCWTIDPRKGKKADSNVVVKPFLLYEKQIEVIHWLQSCIDEEEHGLLEKTRGAGMTWLFCSFSVWLWLMEDDISVGWGSRKAMYVDQIGNRDSIFEKLRFTIRKLPNFALPSEYILKLNSCENKDNGSTIIGEAGDGIGRGGRTTLYFKDESAHYEHPELIEASLSENTHVQIDFSSVNGVGNIFYNKRFGGQAKIMLVDVTDVPWMTKKFLAKKHAQLAAMGLEYKYNQEYLRDYTASVEGIIIPNKWVRAAIDFHTIFEDEHGESKHAAYDPMDEGGDTHALSMKKGMILKELHEWTTGDIEEITAETMRICAEAGYDQMIYDAVGLGVGVRVKANNMTLPVDVLPFKGSWKVAYPDELYVDEIPNSEIFYNFKAQCWWNLRVLFENTYKARKAIEAGEPCIYDHSQLISLPLSLPLLRRLEAELSQPTRKDKNGKIMINKKPDGTKSPNLADSLVMVYAYYLLGISILTW